MECIGKVAYQLKLPPSMGIQFGLKQKRKISSSVFHVSQFKLAKRTDSSTAPIPPQFSSTTESNLSLALVLGLWPPDSSLGELSTNYQFPSLPSSRQVESLDGELIGLYKPQLYFTYSRKRMRKLGNQNGSSYVGPSCHLGVVGPTFCNYVIIRWE